MVVTLTHRGRSVQVADSGTRFSSQIGLGTRSRQGEVTRKGFPPAAIGLTVGITLTLIHLISIPVDNTSVNPARSFGMAVFAGGDAVEQLWAFFVFPLIGAIVGAGAYLLISDDDDALA